jgi:hypothetical protein
MRERARIRLIIAAALFVGWLGWLTYLAATGTQPIILSRPQLLMANAVVRAELTGSDDAPDDHITVQEVLSGSKEQLEGATLEIESLSTCGRAEGWTGPGIYLLALSKSGNTYRIAQVPPVSLGYDPKHDPKPLRIYPYGDRLKEHALEILR